MDEQAWKAKFNSKDLSVADLHMLLSIAPKGVGPDWITAASELLELLKLWEEIDDTATKKRLDGRDWYKEMQQHLEVLGGSAEDISRLLNLLLENKNEGGKMKRPGPKSTDSPNEP